MLWPEVVKNSFPGNRGWRETRPSVRVMYMYATGLLSELGMVRMHKGLYQDSIDVPSSQLSLLVPSQTQHFESTSSIKQPGPASLLPQSPGERRTPHTGERSSTLQLLLLTLMRLSEVTLTFALFAFFLQWERWIGDGGAGPHWSWFAHCGKIARMEMVKNFWHCSSIKYMILTLEYQFYFV